MSIKKHKNNYKKIGKIKFVQSIMSKKKFKKKLRMRPSKNFKIKSKNLKTNNKVNFYNLRNKNKIL